jgi:hypothetical protein
MRLQLDEVVIAWGKGAAQLTLSELPRATRACLLMTATAGVSR